MTAGAAGVAVALAEACSSPPATVHGGGGPSDDAGGDDAGDDGNAGDDGGDGGCTQTCTTTSKTFSMPFTKYPKLKNVGGSALVEIPGYSDPACQQDFVIVVQSSAGKYLAFSASCSHACCTVQFVGGHFICPCHGSTFSLSGAVTGGPAPTGLTKLGVCADDCGVYVTVP